MASFKHMSDKSREALYLLFRIIIGAFFFFHGLGKIMPGFGGPGDVTKFAAFGAFGLVWLAYIIAIGEMTVGLGVLTGVYSRLVSLGGATIMLGAMIFAHFPKGWNPLSNGSELPLLFLAAFMIVFIYGGGEYGLEKLTFKKETF
ncbi:DoxX family protein [Candidatus Woesearchaeota archaeon]|nr:DoxX family protein [Candidatus Woesearchaeota archaeon]